MERNAGELKDRTFDEMLEEWQGNLQDIYQEEKKYADDEAEIWNIVCSKFADYMIACTKRFPNKTLADVAMLTNTLDEIFQDLYGTRDLG